MGPMIKPGRYTQPIRSVDVAPTLAEIVGVPPTEPIDGKPLRMILPASGGR